MATAAFVIAVMSLVASACAVWYARVAAKASTDLAAVEAERLDRERSTNRSAKLVMSEVTERDLIRIRNLGLSSARDVRVTHSGLKFQTLQEDDDAGLEIKPGEVLELIPLIDWEHPINSHARARAHGGTLGVPHFPLTISWKDGNGEHSERRRVEPQHRDVPRQP